VNAMQSEAISPEEHALPWFSRRALKHLPTWDLWHKNKLAQLDQMKALGIYGSPTKLPKGGILMRFHWQHRIEVNGKRRSRSCCGGSPQAAPEVHSTTDAIDCNSYLGAIPWWEPLKQHRQTLAVG